ncbi:hypothetical protein FB567DRAFT_510839 [Paraphoma chrysanthemicola]|uniref:Uncharacterized protein n=1 Tax=Paraphoma chrysanthemicola TaxID=798071 RepID=A0A8K0RG49_9PLEO|nr:hypothetical protein FB567DRAFT_510839 [Paraphoma chrysanthemicola]
MSSATDTRSNRRTWSPAYETAAPAACQTLRNYRNVVEWGYTCVFAEEDGDPVPFSINTACMPWVTPNVYPASSAFYSPATACPTSWSAVSTATSGEQWVSGETALTCCPAGFDGDGRGGCKVGSSGSVPVVQCGEADAEENKNLVYTAGAWPASVTASITALHLRYQASDIGSASATGSNSASSTGGAGSSGSSGNGGLSTGAKVAIGVVIPLVFLVGALAFFLLWRRRKQKKAAAVLAPANMGDEKSTPAPSSVDRSSYQQSPPTVSKGPIGNTFAAHHNITPTNPHETPEWNVEMDATEAERQHLVGTHNDPLSATSPASDVTELGGLARVARKPIAPVEIDGRQIVPEVGDAYIPYRPGREGESRA